MSRIGSAQMFEGAAAALLRNQAELAVTQAQLASGRRVATSADDPLAAGEIVARSASLDAHSSYTRNRDFLQGELHQLETALGNTGDTMQAIREALLQASSPSLTDADRASLATAIDGYRAQLLSLANARGANGQYFFGGYADATPPFVVTGGGSVQFVGDTNIRQVPVAPSLQIAGNADGSAVFAGISGGNGVFVTAIGGGNTGSGRIDTGFVTNPALLTGHAYRLQLTAPGQIDATDLATNAVQSFSFAPGGAIDIDGMRVVISGQPALGDTFDIVPSPNESVFDMIDRVTAALRVPVSTSVDRTRLADGVRRGIADLDQALDRSLAARSDLGNRLSALELADNLEGRMADDASVALARLTDIDYAEASSRFSQQKLARDAALAAYGQFAGTTLFDYLR